MNDSNAIQMSHVRTIFSMSRSKLSYIFSDGLGPAAVIEEFVIDIKASGSVCSLQFDETTQSQVEKQIVIGHHQSIMKFGCVFTNHCSLVMRQALSCSPTADFIGK